MIASPSLILFEKNTPSHPLLILPLGYPKRDYEYSQQVLQDERCSDEHVLDNKFFFTLPFLYLSLRPHVTAPCTPSLLFNQINYEKKLF